MLRKIATMTESSDPEVQPKEVQDVQEENVDENEEEEEEYHVERICDTRLRGSKREFLIKWKGFPMEENTWEPEDNCDCPELISEFMSRRKSTGSVKKADAPSSHKKADTSSAKKPDTPSSKKPDAALAKKQARSSDAGAPAAKKQRREGNATGNEFAGSQVRGFARGLHPDKIIGATDSSGELMFLIKWKDCDEADLVPAREANVKCPQVVIKFYEERLTWHTHDENNSCPSNAVATTGGK